VVRVVHGTSAEGGRGGIAKNSTITRFERLGFDEYLLGSRIRDWDGIRRDAKYPADPFDGGRGVVF
jgi:hypothetical protein